MERAIEILKKYNQEHIIKHMEGLNKEEKAKIEAQIETIDFEELKELYEKTMSEREAKTSHITPIEVIDKEKLKAEEKDEYIKFGKEILTNNKFAVVTMARRTGHKASDIIGPKGSFKVDVEPEGKYLFQIIIEQLIEANKKYNNVIPYYIMTSKENNEETIAFLEEKNYFGYPKEFVKFFKQEEEPLIDKEGKLLVDKNGLIKFASNGNRCNIQIHENKWHNRGYEEKKYRMDFSYWN